MDLATTSKALLVLIFVLLLIVLAGIAFRKFGENGFLKLNKSHFKIKDIVPIDAKRRIVSFELDKSHYTILFGNSDILLDKKDVKKNK